MIYLIKIRKAIKKVIYILKNIYFDFNLLLINLAYISKKHRKIMNIVYIYIYFFCTIINNINKTARKKTCRKRCLQFGFISINYYVMI